MIMLAKGNRSQQVTDACQKHGGFYLGSIGGPAAILAQNNIKSIECVEYPELGMEAIWKIEAASGISDHHNILTLLYEVAGSKLSYGAFADVFKSCHIKFIKGFQ